MYSLTSLKKRRAGPSRPYFLQGFMSINIHPAPRIVQQFHRSAAQFLQDSFSSSLRMPKRRPVSKAMVWDCRFFYASAAPPAPVPRPREKRDAQARPFFSVLKNSHQEKKAAQGEFGGRSPPPMESNAPQSLSWQGARSAERGLSHCGAVGKVRHCKAGKKSDKTF